MLSEIKAIGSEQVQGRREYPVAGGRVLYVPAGTSAPWRAILGTSEYPDAIIAEAEVFARRAARALEVDADEEGAKMGGRRRRGGGRRARA